MFPKHNIDHPMVLKVAQMSSNLAALVNAAIQCFGWSFYVNSFYVQEDLAVVLKLDTNCK